MSQKRRGSKVALVYFTTIAVFFAILGCGAYFILENFVLNDDDSSSTVGAVTTSSEDGVPTLADCVTVLFVGVHESGSTDITAIVAGRFMPTESRLKLVPIAKSTLATAGEETNTLTNHYKNGGISTLTTACENAFGFTVDKYMILTADGWDLFIDNLNGLDSLIGYTIPYDMQYTDPLTGEQTSFEAGVATRTLWGEDLRKLITYPLYEQGEEFNVKITADIIATFINYICESPSYARSILDSSYSTLFNHSVTNISATDFDKMKTWINISLSKTTSPAVFKLPKGVWENGLFTVDDSFKTEIVEYFGY